MRTVIRLISMVLLAAASCHATVAVAQSAGQARKALEARGIAFTSEAFLDAVKSNQIEDVRKFVEAGIDVNTPDASGARPGWTALHWAAYQGQVDIAQLLMAHGADIKALENGYGLTPLHLSLMGRGAAVAVLLLKAGADFRIADRRGYTPLHAAAGGAPIGMIEELIRLGANVNARDRSGYRTPLLASLEARRADIAQLLIRRGAVIRNDDTGRACLVEAAKNGFTDIAAALLSRGVDANGVPQRGATDPALVWAARNGHGQLVDLLLKHRADVDARGVDERSALHSAAYSGHVDVIAALISKGADVNARSASGGNPLTMAAAGGAVDAAMLLISAGAELDVANSGGETPLIAAVRNGKEAVVQALVQKGAVVNSANRDGVTALHSALIRGFDAMALLLIKHGANVNSASREGSTPLMAAAARGSDAMVKVLVDAGAEVMAKNNAGQTARDVALARKQFSTARVLEQVAQTK